MKSSTEKAHCHTYAGGQPITPAEHAGQTGEISAPIAKNTGKHFPDWHACKLGNNADQYAIYDENGRTVAVTHDDPGGRNAQLFEAAPDMLEALLTLSRDINAAMPYKRISKRTANDMIQTIRAAIAKARPRP